MKVLATGVLTLLIPVSLMCQVLSTPTGAVGTNGTTDQVNVNGYTRLINPTGRTLLLEKENDDSWLTFHDPGDAWYSMGIDRSDGVKFKINYGGSLDNSNHFVMTTGGNIGIGTSPTATELLTVKRSTDGNAAAFNGPNSGLTIQPNTSSVDMVGYTAEAGYKSIFLRSGATGLLINPSGNVGIGTTSPQSRLDVYSSGELGSNPGDFLLLNRFYSVAGGGGNYFIDNSWLYRDATGSNWLTARLHKGISIDESYTSPGVNTRTWWERDPFNNIQSWGDTNQTYLTINQGNVGIGTTSPDAKLTVKGTVHAQEVKVDLNFPGPDYVFEENYNLPSLAEIEYYIKQNKHLPEVPSAKEMETNGINLSEMNMVLLKKVEELTLHLIELKKENEQVKKKMNSMQNEINQLKK